MPKIKVDVLIAHPLKHHLYPILKEAVHSNLDLKFYTGFYIDDFIKSFEPFFPKKFSPLFSAYNIESLPRNMVISSWTNKLKRVWMRNDLVGFYKEFDSELAGKILENLIEPKIVHTLQNYMPKTQEACRFKGIKYIYDMIIDSTEDVFSLISKKMYSLERANYNIFNQSEVVKSVDVEHATRLFVPNERLQSKLVETYNVEKDNVKVIPYGVDLQRFEYVPYENKNKKLILVRANSVRKGLDEFLDFIGEFSKDTKEEFKFVIIGEIEKCLLDKYKAIQSDLPKNITLVSGAIDYFTMLKLLRESPILIMPTYREGMSLIVLEAFSTGTILIGSKYTGVSGLENKTNSLLLDKVCPKKIKEAFIMALNNPQLMSDISKKAKEHSKSFSTSNYSLAVIQAYKEVLG